MRMCTALCSPNAQKQDRTVHKDKQCLHVVDDLIMDHSLVCLCLTPDRARPKPRFSKECGVRRASNMCALR